MNKPSYLLVLVFSSFLRGFEMSSTVLQKEQRFVWSSFVPEISSFFGQYLLLCQQIFIPEGILIYDLIPVSHSVKSERCFSITS